jgi:hypothetical protein
MIKVFGSHPCEVCNKRTGWVHKKLNVYLCSSKCQTAYAS